ncbi:MAG: recombinase family protein [Flavobacteriaceae bacterium]
MKIILYVRVSTDEQANKGHGRDYQLELLKRHCEINNYEVIAEFEEDYSAKDFNRPEWGKLETYVKANRKSVDKILFTKWDRFSRNTEEALSKLRKFQNWGIELNAIEQMLDLTNVDNKMMLTIYLTSPEIENDKISQRTRNGMHQAAKGGAWVGRVPFGYNRHRFDKYASLIPNEDSLMVKQIFKEASLYTGSLEKLRKDFRKRGYKKSKQSFYNLLKSKVYIGMTIVPQFGRDDSYWIDGLHEAIINENLYEKVQSIFLKKKKNARFPSSKKVELPLRGFLECESCGNTLTGSTSKGNGGSYHYYHCRNGCKNRIPSNEAHEIFKSNILERISTNDNVLELYKKVLIDVKNKNKGYKRNNQAALKDKINKKQKEIEAVEDRLINNDISVDTFNRISGRYNHDLRHLKLKLLTVENAEEVSNETIDKAIDTFKKLPHLFETCEFEKKTQLLGLMFPNKLVISKKGCRTNKENIVIELLTRIRKASEKLDIKKAIKNDGLSNYAPPLGLEPRTL